MNRRTAQTLLRVLQHRMDATGARIYALQTIADNATVARFADDARARIAELESQQDDINAQMNRLIRASFGGRS